MKRVSPPAGNTNPKGQGLMRLAGMGGTGNVSPGGGLVKNGGLSSTGNGGAGATLQKRTGVGSTGSGSSGGPGIDPNGIPFNPITKVGPDSEDILESAYVLHRIGF